ncbi:MAG: hypothetical protein KDK41_04680 [Leptospiraceae bacterium]|nr:hypothetical protein [Leptospiraceae bacterium]MCB1199918.1 hypothetical protein [Leptospiraceae bacterium]
MKKLAVIFLSLNIILAVVSCTSGECTKYEAVACKDENSEICKKARAEYKDLDAGVCMQKLAEIETNSGMDRLDQMFNEAK